MIHSIAPARFIQPKEGLKSPETGKQVHFPDHQLGKAEEQQPLEN
jgi:hypothetical protein